MPILLKAAIAVVAVTLFLLICDIEYNRIMSTVICVVSLWCLQLQLLYGVLHGLSCCTIFFFVLLVCLLSQSLGYSILIIMCWFLIAYMYVITFCYYVLHLDILYTQVLMMVLFVFGLFFVLYFY